MKHIAHLTEQVAGLRVCKTLCTNQFWLTVSDFVPSTVKNVFLVSVLHLNTVAIPETLQCVVVAWKNKFYLNCEWVINRKRAKNSLFIVTEAVTEFCILSETNQQSCLYCAMNLLFTLHKMHLKVAPISCDLSNKKGDNTGLLSLQGFNISAICTIFLFYIVSRITMMIKLIFNVLPSAENVNKCSRVPSVLKPMICK